MAAATATWMEKGLLLHFLRPDDNQGLIYPTKPYPWSMNWIMSHVVTVAIEKLPPVYFRAETKQRGLLWGRCKHGLALVIDSKPKGVKMHVWCPSEDHSYRQNALQSPIPQHSPGPWSEW